MKMEKNLSFGEKKCTIKPAVCSSRRSPARDVKRSVIDKELDSLFVPPKTKTE